MPIIPFNVYRHKLVKVQIVKLPNIIAVLKLRGFIRLKPYPLLPRVDQRLLSLRQGYSHFILHKKTH